MRRFDDVNGPWASEGFLPGWGLGSSVQLPPNFPGDDVIDDVMAGVAFSDSAPFPNILNPCLVSKFLKYENPTPVQSPATIDATAIQQCLFCTEAMTFVKTVQIPVNAKNKTESGSGSGFSEMLDSGSKNKRRILLESTPDPWPPKLGSIPHKQSTAQN